LVVLAAALWALPSALQSSVAWSQVPADATVYVDRAIIAHEEKRFDDALRELQEALRLDPQNVEALYYRSVVYLILNRPAEAQAGLEKARALRPENPDISFQLGVLYFSQQDYEKAEPLLRRVHQAEPNRPNLGYYLGFIEYRKKNYREALDFLKANVASDENFAQLARFYSGLAMSGLGFPRQGRLEIDEALRLQPISPLTTPAQRFGDILARAAEREKFFRGELRLGVFYDTNVPVVPFGSNDIVSQAILEDQPKQKSEGELASLYLSYTVLRDPNWEGAVTYRFFQTYNNHLTEFNTQSHTPAVSLAYQTSVGQMPLIAGSQLAYDFITLGNRKFSQRWLINPYITLVESQDKNVSNLTTLQFLFQVKDFFNDRDVDRPEVRDALNVAVGPLHFLMFEEGRHYVKLGYQYDFESAEGENWSYSGHRLLTGGQYTLPWWEIRLRYDLDFHWRFHKHRHSLIPVTATGTVRRRDREPLHLVTVAKDFLTDFTVSLEYLFDNNKSNLAPFEYKRHIVTTSVTWRF
jgi:tetratricopeptide (TPR) repeat protein